MDDIQKQRIINAILENDLATRDEIDAVINGVVEQLEVINQSVDDQEIINVLVPVIRSERLCADLANKELGDKEVGHFFLTAAFGYNTDERDMFLSVLGLKYLKLVIETAEPTIKEKPIVKTKDELRDLIRLLLRNL